MAVNVTQRVDFHDTSAFILQRTISKNCCYASHCTLGGKCSSAHKCLYCNQFMHTICGFTIPDNHPEHSICYSQYCNNCHDEKRHERDPYFAANNNKDSSNSEIKGENDTLKDLKRSAMATASTPKRKN